MVIAQTLNRFIGTDLRHGRGVTPSVVARYLLAMPTAVNVMQNLEDYCDFKTECSEQHADLATGRIKRDSKYLEAIYSWIKGHDPFGNYTSLISF